MKYSETRQSATFFKPTKHLKTDYDVNSQVNYRQINTIKGRLLWTSWNLGVRAEIFGRIYAQTSTIGGMA